MSSDVVPELKQIAGTLLFGAARPLSAKDIRRCLVEVAAAHGKTAAVFAEVKERDVAAALDELRQDVERLRLGFHLQEVAGGFRFQTDPDCGVWLKHLLEIGQPNRLSRPSLETLAIIAYRQPVTKMDIERIRGVSIDHVIRMLMEMQLVKIVGRSELPGRPFLFGTTQTFLEHFGLKSLKDLNDVEPMLRLSSDPVGSASRPESGQGPSSEEAGKAKPRGKAKTKAASGDASNGSTDASASKAEAPVNDSLDSPPDGAAPKETTPVDDASDSDIPDRLPEVSESKEESP
jgi:segregation and condensation protein B